nr:hypothetical protein [Tanacetum cinerariifolium]
MQEDKPEIQEVVEVVTTTKVITKVIDSVSETVSVVAVVPAAITETVSVAAIAPTAALVKVDKSKEQMEEKESRALAIINETSAQKAAKRRRLNKEAEDVEELKQHLEIVPDEDDDVYTKATPLARKVPVVDYQIIHVNNKP